METVAPTREWQSKTDFEPPAYDQNHIRLAYRKRAQWEKIKTLEAEHHQAFKKLERYWYGKQGYDVRWDDEVGIPDCFQDFADEFLQFRCATEFEDAHRAVKSPRAWSALMCQIDPERYLSPQDMGHKWAIYKDRKAAKAWGEALILSGLDALCIHWNLVSKPPD